MHLPQHSLTKVGRWTIETLVEQMPGTVRVDARILMTMGTCRILIGTFDTGNLEAVKAWSWINQNVETIQNAEELFNNQPEGLEGVHAAVVDLDPVHAEATSSWTSGKARCDVGNYPASHYDSDSILVIALATPEAEPTINAMLISCHGNPTHAPWASVQACFEHVDGIGD